MDAKDLLDTASMMSTDELIAATEKLQIENAMRQEALDAMKSFSASVTMASMYGNPVPAPPDYGAYIQMTSPYYNGNITGTGSQMWLTGTPSVESQSTHDERVAKDRKLQLKLFIHFAKLFCEKYPQWKLMPEPEDPFGKVKLVRPDLGASIVSLYPSNELAVYGGPDLWMSGLREMGQTLPIVKVFPHTFFGWALDVDVPEWVR